VIYELRIYYMHPGKMQAINDRFANSTLGIFKKHDMRVTDFWEDLDEEHNRLYYVVEFSDMEAREQAWEVFRNDPEWHKVKSDSEKDGPIVEKIESVFLKKAAYFS
jgi:hypothetical protein